MRVDLKKVLFYGVKGSLESFFNKVQELGLVQFIDNSKNKLREIPSEIQILINAIKVVRTFPTMKQEELHSIEEADPLADRILALQATLQKFEEETHNVQLKIEEILPFGRFSAN